MQKYVSFIFVLFFIVCIAACGGGSTTAATAVYDHPTTLATPNTSMGGAIQLPLRDLSNTASASIFTGTAGTAGIGFTNYSGNSTNTAKFNHPTDITTADGTVFYVADYTNNAIRKIITSGGVPNVSTLQCTDADSSIIGFHLPFSLTISPDGAHLYVVDSGLNAIRIVDLITNKVTTIGSTTGVAGSVDSLIPTAVRFKRPTGITTDGENLYVTDSGNNTIRRIDLKNNNAVSTLAGTSGAIGSADGDPHVARFNIPQRITTDGTNLYVTDFNNRTIRKIDILTGNVSTIAGKAGPLETAIDGIGSAARFRQPNGITTDGTYLYVTDSYLNTIRRIGIADPYNVVTIPVPDSTLHTPIGITTDGHSLFVADTFIEHQDPVTHINTYSYSNSIIKVE
ncbi:MAG: hypothetical protein PHH28_03780 [Desulfuromonadaceae bacterium]|nr:hypothetical protein [Desulfuromonadaceae bacterium]